MVRYDESFFGFFLFSFFDVREGIIQNVSECDKLEIEVIGCFMGQAGKQQ